MLSCSFAPPPSLLPFARSVLHVSPESQRDFSLYEGSFLLRAVALFIRSHRLWRHVPEVAARPCRTSVGGEWRSGCGMLHSTVVVSLI